MFNLEQKNEFFSKAKIISKTKKGYWTIREHYYCKGLSFEFWKYTFEHEHLPENAVLKKHIFIPLNWSAFYHGIQVNIAKESH